jgi:L-lysine 2,3-aminomutase
MSAAQRKIRLHFQLLKKRRFHRYRTELLLILRLANARNQLLCILLPRYCFRQRHLQSISAAVGVKQRAAAASPFSIAIELTTVL